MDFPESLDLDSDRRKVLFGAVLILLFPFLLNAVLVVTPLEIPIPDQLECEQRVPDSKFIYTLEAGEFVPDIGGIRHSAFAPVGGHGVEEKEKINLEPCRTDSYAGFAESVIRSKLDLPRKNVSTFE